MLRIDKSCDPPRFLHLRNRMQRDRRLTAGLRPVYLYNPPLRQSPKPKRDIQAQRSRRYCLHIHAGGTVAKLHNGTLAILFFNL